MTAKRTYFCNLCRDEIHNDANSEQQDGRKAGYGFSYPNGNILVLDIRSHHENHICDSCLKLMKGAKIV